MIEPVLESLLPPVSRPIRILTLVLSLVMGLSALAGAGLALAPLLGSDQRPAWILFGFEVVVLAGAVVGVLFGRGRFGEAPGLALACIAGTFAVASILGWQAAGRQLNGISLNPFVAIRVLVALALGTCGAWCVLSRRETAWRSALLGVTLGVPVVLAVAALVIRSWREAIAGHVGSGGAAAAAAVIGFLFFGGLLSASAHFLIRAFELGRTDEEPAKPAGPTSSRSA